MKINRIASYVCAGLMTVSCHHGKTSEQKAIEMASKYLTGTELAETQRLAQKFNNMDLFGKWGYADNVLYWDSILCAKKETEGYYDGLKFVIDSVNGNHYQKYCTRIPSQPVLEPIDVQQYETGSKVAKYFSGRELKSLQEKQPYSGDINVKKTAKAAYYGEQAAEGAYRKGFNKGANTAKKEFGLI